MDNRSLDRLNQFAAFLEFLTNPDEAKQLLARLTEATKEHNAAVESVRGTKEFQLWRNQELDKLNKQEQALAAKMAEFETLKLAAKVGLDEANTLLEKRESVLKDSQAKLNALEQAVTAKLAEATALESAKAEFEQEKAAFARTVEEFNKKKEAVEALLKG